MTTTSSDNSGMNVIKVEPGEIRSYLKEIGCEDCTVAGVFCEIKEERMQSLDNLSANTTSGTDASSANASGSGSSSSGTNKANIEFGDSNLASIEQLLGDPKNILELLVNSRDQREEASKEQPTKGERE